jgi:hypothetical protein
MRYLALLVLLVACPLHAQQPGRDPYALQYSDYDSQTFIASGIPGASGGNLDTTFGTDITPIDSALSHLHPNIWRVHILNAVCVRNSNCGPYEILHGYTIGTLNKALEASDQKILSPYKDRVKLYCILAVKYPSTKIAISPALEHNMTPKAWRVLADATLETCAHVQLVNSPVGGIAAERYKGAWIEAHGSADQIKPGLDGYSMDGANASDIDIQAWLKRTKGAKYRNIWGRQDNCRDQNPTFTDPRRRKACPKTKSYYAELAHIGDTFPPPPRIQSRLCVNREHFVSPMIWKPTAENSGNGDQRADLPCSITDLSGGQTVGILDSKGNKVGTLGYFGTFTGGLFRHYSGYPNGSRLNGYDFQVRAMASSGSPYVWLNSGKNCIGPILPGQRQGKMRDK